jgi:hypothetical protein
MNERIKQLAEQAEKYASEKDGKYDGAGNLNWQWQDINMEKFAELIVRECARLAIEKQTENDVSGIVSKNPAKDFAYALVEHFGVEE